jgi:hypothetical protein
MAVNDIHCRGNLVCRRQKMISNRNAYLLSFNRLLLVPIYAAGIVHSVQPAVSGHPSQGGCLGHADAGGDALHGKRGNNGEHTWVRMTARQQPMYLYQPFSA